MEIIIFKQTRCKSARHVEPRPLALGPSLSQKAIRHCLHKLTNTLVSQFFQKGLRRWRCPLFGVNLKYVNSCLSFEVKSQNSFTCLKKNCTRPINSEKLQAFINILIIDQ